LKKSFKIIGKIALAIIAILLSLWMAIQLQPVQNFLIQQVTNKLSTDLHSEVSIKKISFSFFDKLNVEGLLVKDKKKDTLLYAGVFTAHVNDFFFLRQKTELKYIGLEDAVINLNRTDSVWNYQYIINYFSSPKDTSKKQKEIHLDLKTIDLKNITFSMNDIWDGQKISAHLDRLILNANKIDVNNEKFDIDKLDIDAPSFTLYDFKGLNPDSTNNSIDKPIDHKKRRNQSNIWFKTNVVTIKNGSFKLEKDNEKPANHFDGAHVNIFNINSTLKNIVFNKDTLHTNVEVNAKERCGLILKKLTANLVVTPRKIEFSKLDMLTNKSHLGDYYAMRYKTFGDFKHYLSSVVMDAKIKNSTVFSDDIAYFAPNLNNWKKEVSLSGNFLGTVENFETTNLFARTAGTTTTVQGNLKMKGLPEIDQTTINFSNGFVKTNSEDLKVFIPELKEVEVPNLSTMGTILFRGSFDGTLTNFNTKGVISSNIGAIDATIDMKFPKKAEPVYAGSLITKGFNLGKFVNSTQIGLVDFTGTISGSSFDINKIDTKLSGTFSELEFNGYNYSNITTNGDIVKNYFNGDVKIDDPNLDFTSTVVINLSNKQPSINVLGDLHSSNFKNLKLTNDEIELTGLLDLNFTGRNIDEFVGTAKILNASLWHQKNKLEFDSLILSTQQNELGQKSITLNSNQFSLNISGKNYQLLDLPTAFQTYLSNYFPSYFPTPTVSAKNQDFKVSFTTKDFDSYAKIIDKKLGGLNYATITGSVNTNTNEFDFEANIPNLSYGKYHLNDANITGDGSLDTMKLSVDISNIRIGDSINFPNTNLNIVSSNDYSDVQLKTKANKNLNEASINAGITTLEDGLRIDFNPSSFVINEKKWNLEKTGEIVLRKNFASADNVKFTQGLQEIKVETQFDNEVGNANNLIIKLKNVVLGDITSLFMKNPQFEGLSNGEIRLNDFYGDFKANASIKVDQFRMDTDSIGAINVNADYVNTSGLINFNLKSPNKNFNLNTTGFYNVKDSIGNPLYINTQLSEVKAGLIQRFVGDIFSDVVGSVNGNLIIKGDPNNPTLLGKVKLLNGGLRVNYTQVYYTIDSATINFEDDGINFGQLTIKDKYQNTALVKGKLYEKAFKNIKFDFGLTTNKLLLNDTKAKDNKQFYGNAIGKAKLSFKGPENATVLKLVAEANDSSHIYIPNSLSKESGDAGFIVFKSYGTEMQTEDKKSNFDLTVDLDITANKFVKIDVILDELTGDVIKAVGNGRLKIVAGTSIPFTMKGRYNIDKGSYDFNFQSFIRKPFELLTQSGNYIEWTGDPLNADIHIDAQYTAERVSVSDLITSQQVSVSSATKSYRGTVYVIASLRDKLTKPTITFSIDFPQGSPVKTDAVFNEFLNRIESDQGEMLSQATSLIVFGAFAPYGQGVLTGSGGSNINNFGVNTISQIVTKQVNKVVSNILYKLTGDKSLRFDLGSSVYSSSSILDQSSGLTSTNNNHLDRTNLTVKIGKSFFNDNVIITFGGDLDFNVGATSAVANGNFQWLPDLNIELVLTHDKRLRGIVFSKNSLDISGTTLGKRNRQGVSLSYKLDFDRLFALKPKEVKIPYRGDSEDD